MEKSYHFDEDFLNGDVCGVATQYAIYKHLFYRNESTIKNSQSNSGTEFYADPLTESILTFLTPHVQNIVGEELLPQYSLLRYYSSGDGVNSKIASNNSDYTSRIVLGQDFKGVDESYKWSTIINGEYIQQNVGSLLIYDSNVESAKEPFLGSMGSYQIEMISFWVNKDKPNLKFDGRNSLGMRKI